MKKYFLIILIILLSPHAYSQQEMVDEDLRFGIKDTRQNLISMLYKLRVTGKFPKVHFSFGRVPEDVPPEKDIADCEARSSLLKLNDEIYHLAENKSYTPSKTKIKCGFFNNFTKDERARELIAELRDDLIGFKKILNVIEAKQNNPNNLRLCEKINYSNKPLIDAPSHWDQCWGVFMPYYTVDSKEGYKDKVYEGEWRKGKLNGYAVLTTEIGSQYIGIVQDGRPHGRGYFSSLNFILKGEFQFGSPVRATSIYFKGEKTGTYEGEFNDWKRSGLGKLIETDGTTYVGEFKNGFPEGLGVKNLTAGGKFSGEFREGQPRGQGIYIDKKGKRYEGIVENGQLVREFKIHPDFENNLLLIAEKAESYQNQLQANAESRTNYDYNRSQVVEDKSRADNDALQRAQAGPKQRLNLQVTNTLPNADGDLTINIQTNADTASLKINGEELGGRPDGKYTVKKVARAGQDTQFIITAKDINGNTDTKTIMVSRMVAETKIIYPTLDPARIKRQQERDAVAIIIGISNYKNLPKADFAKDDAQVFVDYAIRALGVRPGNIKLLMDEQADAEEIYTTFKSWLPARVKSTTDVYVFYSGHGLPTDDGKSLYWLPQRANRELISKTAIQMQEIIADLQTAKPKSVTLFMDACYSGQTRTGETLIASARPVTLKMQASPFPANFTILSASQADQISSSSPDLKHGIFSYYLMRALEGDADNNKDGKITLGEIKSYLAENVSRQARIMNRQQDPQIMGESEQILVGR